MKKKYLVKIAAGTLIAFTAAMTLETAVIPASAADDTTTGITAAAVDSTHPVKFEQYLIMNQDAYTPTMQFQYSIGAGLGGTYNGMKVYSPSDTTNKDGKLAVGMPTVGRASFTPDQTTYDGTAVDASNYGTASNDSEATTNSTLGVGTNAYKIDDNVTLAAGQKYAKSDVTIDFSNVTFYEPGIYRYVITEAGTYVNKGSNSLFESNVYTLDSNKTRILDVYVESKDGDNALGVTQYILRNGIDDTDTKTTGFANTYKTHDITLKKTISGNQARTDVDFEFTFWLEQLPSNTKVKINTTSTAASGNTVSDGGTLLIPSYSGSDANDGSLKFTMWLKAGETVTIHGVPNMTDYMVKENSDTLKELGYTASVPSGIWSSNNLYSYSTWLLRGYANKEVSLEVNNEKNGVIPTGIIVSVAPYAGVTLAGFAGLIVFAIHKKSKEEDE